MGRVAAWVLAVVMLPGCLIEPLERDACELATSCAGCSSRSGCGWCSDGALGGECLPGTSVAPLDRGSCLPARWHFARCEQQPPASACSARIFCSTCTDESDCGWCVPSSSCRERRDPGGCSLVTSGASCGTATCASATSCGACHAAGCSWCDDGGGPGGAGRCIEYTAGSCEIEHLYLRSSPCP